MPHYKDNNNQIHFLDNPEFGHLLPDGCVEINDEEANSILVANALIKPYVYQRAAEYPSFADQFDLLYHGGYDAWKEVIQIVKDKYPKE